MHDLDFTKNKDFCSVKGTVKRRERSQILGKIFAKHLSNKGLLSQIQKELLKQKLENNQSNWKTGNKSEQTPHQGRYTDSKLAYKKMLKIICYQGIATYEEVEIVLHTYQNDNIS